MESTSSDHANLPGHLNNLGISYSGRFKLSGNLQDIDHAISHHQKAVESTPSGHANLPHQFNNLANSYFNRFKHTGDLQDIDCAISHHHTAVETTPSGYIYLAGLFYNLGNLYLARFQSTHCLSDIQNSIASYRQSAQANGIPSIRLKAANSAAIHSSVYDKSQCLNDFAMAISLLSEVAGLKQKIHRHHFSHYGCSGLVESAVALALHYNRPDLALEWLEQGHSLVWNQLNQLYTPIDNLYVRSSSLANTFVQVARSLESYGTHSSSILSPNSTPTEHIHVKDSTHKHYVAAKYANLLKEIRCLPNFHDFLQPPNATNLLFSLPPDGPVIIFNTNKCQCDALALICGIDEPLHIPLENFSSVEAEKLQDRLQSDILKQQEAEDGDYAGATLHSMAFVLKELWHKVVYPVLQAIGYSVSSVDHQIYLY